MTTITTAKLREIAHTLVYTVLLFTAHIAYIDDLNRSETHDDD